MKILITGAAGQIGSSLSKRLVKQGHELLLVDNFRNGYKGNLLVDGELIAPFKEIDITSPDFFREVEGSFDAIIHLAAITALPDCESNPTETIRINVGGTSAVLELARKLGVPHVVFASTSAVYENSKAEIFTEDLPITPTLYYCLSKKMGEELVSSYQVNYGLKVTTLRFFNVFGPDGDQNRPHPPLLNFCAREYLRGRAPELSGDGTQVRDFVWAGDVVSMLDLCLRKVPNDIFNVCTGTVTSVNQIARWTGEALGLSSLGIKYKPAQELWSRYPAMFQGKFPLAKEIVAHETLRPSRGSYAKAERVLGWKPDLNIEQLVKSSVLEIAKKSTR